MMVVVVIMLIMVWLFVNAVLALRLPTFRT